MSQIKDLNFRSNKNYEMFKETCKKKCRDLCVDLFVVNYEALP